MNDFNIRFVELCGRERALYDLSRSSEIEEAAVRVSRALQQRGFSFGPGKVKPMFDRVRALYEDELQNRAEGRCSELKWFHSMDVYMRPFVRLGSENASSCPNDAPVVEKVAEGIECEDDTPCDVCGSALPEDRNEMIFCNMCNVCVHQACYGVPVVPKGDWYCGPCQLKVKPSCALCPKEGGAMKITRDGRQWAHVSCAWWIKEVRIGCPKKMEPIDRIWDIPPSRWNLVCSLCRVRYGACIQCAESSCTVAYHVTCAFDKGLKMDMCNDPEKEDGVKLLSYCRKHRRLIDNPQSEKKRKPKKRTRRNSSDIESPWTIQSQTHEISVTETVTSIVNENELSEAGSTSDGNSQSSGVQQHRAAQPAECRTSVGNKKSLSRILFRRKGSPENETTGSGHSSEEEITTPVNPCPDDPLRKTMTRKVMNGGKHGDKPMWNTQTTATQPSQESLERHSNGMHKEHQSHETGGDGHSLNFNLQTSETKNKEPPPKKKFRTCSSGEPPIEQGRVKASCSKSYETQEQISTNYQSYAKSFQLYKSSDEGPPEKRIRLLESSRKHLPDATQAKNKSMGANKPSTATFKRQISFDNDLSSNQQSTCSDLPHAAQETHKTTLESHQYAVQNTNFESFIDPADMRQGETQLICSNLVSQDRQQTQYEIPSTVTADEKTTTQDIRMKSCSCKISPTTQFKPHESFSTQPHEIKSDYWPTSVMNRPNCSPFKNRPYPSKEEHRSPFKMKLSAVQEEYRSPFKNKPSAVEKEHCSPLRNQVAAIHKEEYCSPFEIHLPSTEEKHCSSCQQHTSAKQCNHQSFNEQPFAIPQEHCSPFKTQPPVTQEESSLPSTSAVQDAFYPTFREQPSSGSFIQKETMESESSTKRHFKTVNYEQLTKFITVHLKSVSPQKAMQLERKIINLCLKSRRTSENPKKD